MCALRRPPRGRSCCAALHGALVAWLHTARAAPALPPVAQPPARGLRRRAAHHPERCIRHLHARLQLGGRPRRPRGRVELGGATAVARAVAGAPPRGAHAARLQRRAGRAAGLQGAGEARLRGEPAHACCVDVARRLCSGSGLELTGSRCARAATALAATKAVCPARRRTRTAGGCRARASWWWIGTRLAGRWEAREAGPRAALLWHAWSSNLAGQRKRSW
jgi:hypothetical protein